MAEVMESDQLTGDNVTEDDNLIADMSVYITTSVYPKECSITRKRVIRKKAKKFQVTGGELFYKQKKKGIVGNAKFAVMHLSSL